MPKLHMDISERQRQELDKECERLGVLKRAELVRRVLDDYLADTATERAKMPKKGQKA